MTRALLLLHGLGGTGSVWGPLRGVAAWDGPVLAPTLAGHGGERRLERYSAQALAADLDGRLDRSRPLAVLGHSLGGVVALALAALRDVDVVVGFGTKTVFSESDVARGAALAARPASRFATRDEAMQRATRVAGISGPPDGRYEDLVEEVGGAWALAVDPRVNAIEPPDVHGLAGAAGCPVHLLRGEHDEVVSADELRAAHSSARDLPGLGHSPHVHAPEQLWVAVRGALTP